MLTATTYQNAKKELLEDKTICAENRKLFKETFEKLEYRLKRKNDLKELDEPSLKTCYGYIHKLKNVNDWFKNNPWVSLTQAEMKRVYDDLEDGKIKTKKGKPFKDKRSYENKIFKGIPFKIAGKIEIWREVMEFTKGKEDTQVRFIDEETFKKMASVVAKPTHKLLFWVDWDTGENINAVLKLKKKNCVKQKNPHTKEYEYAINFPKEILKRTRRTRTEITNFNETTQLLDIVLNDLEDEDNIFPFQYGMAKKIFSRAVKLTKARCIPQNLPPTWKDLRSGMACYLLKSGWTTNEINARLGHTPSSTVLDKYVNFLALDRHQPKKKIIDNDIDRLREDFEAAKKRERLTNMRLEGQKEENEELKERLAKLENVISKYLEKKINERKK